MIHTEIVAGDSLKLIVVPKGGGSENMSRVHMLKPAEGWAGVKEKVVATVREAGPNPCPPIIVGVGIGGTFERAALLSKKSLIRELGLPHADPELAKLERELLLAVNDLGIGPQGLGGRITALAVQSLDAAVPHRLPAGGRQYPVPRLPAQGSDFIKVRYV